PHWRIAVDRSEIPQLLVGVLGDLSRELRIVRNGAVAIDGVTAGADGFRQLFGAGGVRSLILGMQPASDQKQRKQKGTLDHGSPQGCERIHKRGILYELAASARSPEFFS